MKLNRIHILFSGFLFFTFSFFCCQSKTKEDNTQNYNFEKPKPSEKDLPGPVSNDQQTNKPSLAPQSSSLPKKNTGPKVKVTAYEISPNPEGGNDLRGDQNYFIPVDTENLAIGGHPLTITKIRGLEQLKNVRHLILYGINYRFSDVFEAIKIFSNTVEKIVFVNCNIKDTSITDSFQKLKAIVIRNCEIFSTTTSFNFTSNEDLEYFYLFITFFPQTNDKEEETLKININSSERMKFISIDTNASPLIINKELCDKLTNVDTFAILKTTFDYGKNDYNLFKEYHNMILYDSPLGMPDKDVPFEYQFDTLCDDTNFEVIGAM